MNNTNPTARIGVKRNLVPSGTNVYLKSGQEFEIELYNPTQHNILAKIYINGEAVSDSGLIIKPGRREWLERYIDKPRKFKFDTYEVEAGNSDVKAAIKDNGSIKVEFYKEKTKNNYLILDGSFGNPYKPYSPPPSFPPQPDIWYGPVNTIYGGTGSYYPNGTFTTNSIGTLNSSDSTCNTSYTVNGDFGFNNNTLEKEDVKSLSLNNLNSSEPKVEETGRINAGSHSNQEFTIVDMDFDSWMISFVEYKLLPLSKKPVIASEINVYCTSCGSKQKKTSWKFCPMCSNKF